MYGTGMYPGQQDTCRLLYSEGVLPVGQAVGGGLSCAVSRGGVLSRSSELVSWVSDIVPISRGGALCMHV